MSEAPWTLIVHWGGKRWTKHFDDYAEASAKVESAVRVLGGKGFSALGWVAASTGLPDGVGRVPRPPMIVVEWPRLFDEPAPKPVQQSLLESSQ